MREREREREREGEGEGEKRTMRLDQFEPIVPGERMFLPLPLSLLFESFFSIAHISRARARARLILFSCAFTLHLNFSLNLLFWLSFLYLLWIQGIFLSNYSFTLSFTSSWCALVTNKCWLQFFFLCFFAFFAEFLNCFLLRKHNHLTQSHSPCLSPSHDYLSVGNC